MMQLALRPYVTPGVAIAGAALIAVNAAVPTAVLRHPAEARQALQSVERHAVQLTADFFGPWTDLFTNTTANLVAMGSDNGWGNLFEQIFTDPSSLSRLPEVFDWLGSIMPQVSGSDPIMILLSPILTIGMGFIGPMITVHDAYQDILNQIFNPSDPLDPFAAMFTAPARLLDAYLNGTSTVDVLGIQVPAFNGILVPGQNLVIDMTAGDLVNELNIGNETISSLLDQTGIGTLSIADMLTGVLDAVGLGDQTPVDLLDTLGLGDLEVASVLSTLTDALGIGNPTIADIMDQIGIGNVQVADLVIDFTEALGFNNPTINDIAGDVGLADLKLADLGMTVFNALGIGDPTVSGLLDTIGAGDLTLNGLLTTAVDALGLGGSTPATLLDAMGIGQQTTHEFVGSLLNGLGLGNQTIMDLLSQAGLADADLGALAAAVLGPAGDTSMADVLDYAGFGTVTVKDLTDLMGLTNFSLGALVGNLNSMGLIGNLTIDDFLAASGATPLDKGGDTTLASALAGTTIGSILEDQGMLNSPLISLLGDMGNQSLVEVIQANFSMTLGDMLLQGGMGDQTLSELVLSSLPNQPLSELLGVMGNTTLAQLIDQMVPSNVTIVDMLNDAGIGDQHLSDLLNQFLGDQTVANALDDGGLGSMHLNDIISQALGTQSLNDMLNEFGIGGQSLSDLFDQFFGTTTISEAFAGLGSQTLNELVDSLFGSATLSSLLGDFGAQTVDELLASLGLGDLTLINAQIEEFFGSMAYFIDGLPNQIAEILGG
ncbi:hypothetical protein AWC16_19870 [Mycolicibacter longobardus]|uniref:Uncharacterized protein n=2 Tax=Mycolicibacter longobardus TaxID=1108812 RepID=A0A1X1YAT8_9MYCO|nr:hypothetical protein AWC16_19870 [Mycolicibacter longobardus]